MAGSHRVVINPVQIDRHRGARQRVVCVPAVDVTAEHRVRTVSGQHGMRAVGIVCAVGSGRGSHGCGTLRVDRLRGRSWRRRGIHFLLDPRLQAGSVVRVTPFLVLQPERSVVHAEHPGRLAEPYAAVPDGVQRSDEVLVRLRVRRSFPLDRGLRTGAGTLAVARTLRRRRRPARRRVLQRPVRGVRVIRQGATGTSRAGTSVLIADARGGCYFGRGKS